MQTQKIFFRVFFTLTVFLFPQFCQATEWTITVPAVNDNGIVSAYTTGFSGATIPGAWIYISLVPNGGLASIDGSRYDNGFVLHGDPFQRLTGTVDQFGFLGLPPSRFLSGCWSFDGTNVTLHFGDTNPCQLADWNLDGRVSTQDIFDFISGYLATPMPESTLFDFLAAWFGATP